jgi:hypothetical protein
LTACASTEFVAKHVPPKGFELSVRLHQRTARTLSDWCVAVGGVRGVCVCVTRARSVTVILDVCTDWGGAHEDEKIVCVRLSSEPVRDHTRATYVGSVEFV